MKIQAINELNLFINSNILRVYEYLISIDKIENISQEIKEILKRENLIIIVRWASGYRLFLDFYYKYNNCQFIVSTLQIMENSVEKIFCKFKPKKTDYCSEFVNCIQNEIRFKEMKIKNLNEQIDTIYNKYKEIL
jgi:hypothetical protein